jgi:hypothetical protein
VIEKFESITVHDSPSGPHIILDCLE